MPTARLKAISDCSRCCWSDHRLTAQALLATGGLVSAQVLNEFASVAQRNPKRSWLEVKAALAAVAVRAFCPDVRSIDVDTHEPALEFAQRDGITFYDTLIVVSALQAGCTTHAHPCSAVLCSKLLRGSPAAGTPSNDD